MPGRRASEEARREQILRAAYDVARHAGIDGVTVRAVAAEAGLSHGLVLFHFGRKDQLVASLLDRILATTTILRLSGGDGRHLPTPDHLRTLLRREVEQLVAAPDDLRLFFEYWALGVRQPAIRAKIGTALERYRDAFRALAEDALRNDASGRPETSPDGFAAVAVSLISGGAVQAMADPDTFDMDAYLATVRTVVEQLAKPATAMHLGSMPTTRVPVTGAPRVRGGGRGDGATRHATRPESPA